MILRGVAGIMSILRGGVWCHEAYIERTPKLIMIVYKVRSYSRFTSEAIHCQFLLQCLWIALNKLRNWLQNNVIPELLLNWWVRIEIQESGIGKILGSRLIWSFLRYVHIFMRNILCGFWKGGRSCYSNEGVIWSN